MSGPALSRTAEQHMQSSEVTAKKKLQDSSLPDILFVPAPWVVTIGSSSPEEMDRVIEYVRARIEQS